MPVCLASIKDALSISKDLVTILAAVSALLFFGYRAFAGWFLLNLTPQLTLDREPVPGGDDRLLVRIALVKGKIDSIRLLSAELLLTPIEPLGLSLKPRSVSNIRRLDVTEATHAVQWTSESKNRYINLSSEETMGLVEYFRVTPRVVFRVDLVVTGDRFRFRVFPSISQWRTSSIALPAKEVQ